MPSGWKAFDLRLFTRMASFHTSRFTLHLKFFFHRFGKNLK